RNRWADVTAGGDVTGSVRRRFDLMVAALGLDRSRAAGWTLGRILQDVLWDVEDGATVVGAGVDRDRRRGVRLRPLTRHPIAGPVPGRGRTRAHTDGATSAASTSRW